MNKIFSVFDSVHKNKIDIYGLTDELKALYIYNYYKKHNNNVIVLTSSLYDASIYYDKLKNYSDNVLFFPDDEYVTKISVASSPELEFQRIDTLSKLNDKSIIVTNLTAFLKKLPNLSYIQSNKLKLEINQNISRDNLSDKLSNLGFKFDSLVTTTGEASIRGFIVDLYPLNENDPIRIEFFGDYIESIRYFNVETQLSYEKINEIEVLPLNDNFHGKENIYSLLDNPFLFKIDNEVIATSNKILLEDSYNIESLDILRYDEINIKNYINLNTFKTKNSIVLNSSQIELFNNDYNVFEKFVKKHKNIKFVSSYKKYLDKIKIDYDVEVINFPLNEGFMFDGNYYLSSKEIFGKRIVKKDNPLVKTSNKIKDYKDLNIGDYVVHYNHGIGIYKGLITIPQNNVKKDFLLIKYHGEDKIYVPVNNIKYLYKYGEKTSYNVRLDSLSSNKWEKTKKSVRKEIVDLAYELMERNRKRENSTISPFITFPEEEMFGLEFEYELTKDQTKSISEIDEDLKNNIPMDRLLVGDVGFGKTEVAFRGMFKTVINGYQTMYLCPTTILSRQQYLVAEDRFKSFNLNIRLLNRYTSPKEEKEIYEDLSNGKIDILFATHKGFNKKVKFKNLGLVIVDEEQRFGVRHKELIKDFKINVNVLTLSATPIPRTLKMALGGLKKLSLIETPPAFRHPVQTYVIEENFPLIKDAIYKEKSRSGQVYILYNNVKKMDELEAKINKEIPNVKTVIAHGQMNKNTLENRIEEFIDKKYDVLICSTIIETGIDISNVNTLIILNSQNFGLSQLYQLRGRVGRGDKIAYAYLMFDKHKVLTESAEKRLDAIKDFTALGSGYKIAMRDLSLRGAGDVLGSRQAGFVNKVGLELYSKFLKEVFDDEEVVYYESDSKKHFNIDNHIRNDYVMDEDIKIEIHDIINSVKDYSDISKIKNILENRFGKLPSNLELYMYETILNTMLNKLNINKIELKQNLLEILLPKEIKEVIPFEVFLMFLYKLNDNLTINNKLNNMYITYYDFEINKENLLTLIEILKYIKSII